MTSSIHWLRLFIGYDVRTRSVNECICFLMKITIRIIIDMYVYDALSIKSSALFRIPLFELVHNVHFVDIQHLLVAHNLIEYNSKREQNRRISLLLTIRFTVCTLVHLYSISIVRMALMLAFQLSFIA